MQVIHFMYKKLVKVSSLMGLFPSQIPVLEQHHIAYAVNKINGWGSLQREMVKMILIRRYVPYPDCRNSKPWSVKGVSEIFGGFPRKIALKSAA
ncbi:hypothetical protein NPIL_675501 [Nephila pilipes]|uniref:Uncharacterized protein n=1 Tax=Nephila pilipes TaxID=299642 RepID=A0A8X6N4A3_NEPPI|nr:hypothetical protein NPIL_675501 [Nephila pilipes]